MKSVERASMWHHTVFSAVLCVAMIGLIAFRRDTSTLFIVTAVMFYVAGNTYLHVRHKDFRRETLYEYLLVSAAVFVVLLGAARN